MLRPDGALADAVAYTHTRDVRRRVWAHSCAIANVHIMGRAGDAPTAPNSQVKLTVNRQTAGSHLATTHRASVLGYARELYFHCA